MGGMRSFAAAVAALGAAFLSGCTTYTRQGAQIFSAWESGNVSNAAAMVSRKVQRAKGGKDDLIWNLEYATMLMTLNDYPKSLDRFNYADRLIEQYEQKARISISRESAALLSNQAALPYRGRSYDKIMVSAFKALEYMALGDFDTARVELNRCYLRQQQAVEENARRLEKAEKLAEKSKGGELVAEAEKEEGQKTEAGEEEKEPDGYDVDRALRDPVLAEKLAEIRKNVDAHLRPYADYVNPFTVFLMGIYFYYRGTGGADLEKAHTFLRRAAGMVPGKYVRAEYEACDALLTGRKSDTRPFTYIFFLTGSAPSREQIRIDIPLFIAGEKPSYIGAAFPVLEYNDNYRPDLVAETAGGRFASELLCDMDAVVARDYKNELPVIITKTLVSTATKALISYAAERATEDSNIWLKYGTRLASITYQSGTNIADTRTWRTLPKQIRLIRLPTPADGRIRLQSGGLSRQVTVSKGRPNIVLVRSISRSSPLFVRRFPLE